MKVRTASGKIRELSEKEITERIEKSSGKKLAEAWSGKDLAEVTAQSGMSRVVLLVWFRAIAEKSLKLMSEDIKNAFRDRSKDFEKGSASLKELSRKLWASTLPPLGYPLRYELRLKSLEPLMRLDLEADSLGKAAISKLSFIKRNGQKDGLDLLVREILKRNKHFNCWAALQRVLNAADVSVSTDALRKKRDLYFDELGIAKEKRP